MNAHFERGLLTGWGVIFKADWQNQLLINQSRA
ncbi:hypothetical protein N748_12350 [Legionella pneumophila str. 121004]|nr:hypothetical protein N748_12350 [Legionella pneumophila str. 121004]ERH44859.1 hypothetical protein N751_12995 [Legionella pneumophila str. Leg01/11]ERH45489.1 hypothetical protein N750_01500 [Legionella pneumophila str. Leg01/53]ERI47194.1 hypothetical protein N749_02995 [Legionella pneumophila str. Leg01/20]